VNTACRVISGSCWRTGGEELSAGIAELDSRDVQGFRSDAEELHAAVTNGIGRNLVLDGGLQTMGHKKLPTASAATSTTGARFGERNRYKRAAWREWRR